MKKLLGAFILLPFLSLAQEQGIRFENGLSWEQVKQKAKAENKYIFIDYYATWCAPCKYMDKEVYPTEKVGEYINDKFISIKVQVDTSKQDNDDVKKWYADARAMQQKYNVTSLPTYLFFTPEGKEIHRGAGGKEADEFVKLASNALDPGKQYYTLLAKYSQGMKDYKIMPYLASSALSLEEKEIAYEIAKDYKVNYLETLPDSLLCQKKHFDFMELFNHLLYEDGSKGIFFRLFYTMPDKVDETMGNPGFADYYVKAIISKEEIEDKLWRDKKAVTGKPNWKQIRSAIENKYNAAYASTLVLESQVVFYRKVKDWKNYVVYTRQKMKRYPPKAMGKLFGGAFGDEWALNGIAWDIFGNCMDKKVLSKALVWSNRSLELETRPDMLVQFYDTKANLLYKLGQVKEAIVWEEKAFALDTDNAKKEGRPKGGFFDIFSETLTKMKNGTPTWSVK